jgi:autotransporter-associated beta strand protein
MTWTGTAGNAWDGAANNWQGSATATKFAGGDAVVFNAAADSTIAIIDGARRVSGIVVDGAATTTFTGGGIIATAHAGGDAEAAVLDAGGRLVKQGAGTLVLANVADNFFHGGIELAAGALEFSRAGQIQTGTAALRVTGSATLRARGDADIETVIELAGAGIAMEMDTGTNTVRHTLGKITGAGALYKTGSGALVLATANDYAGGTTLREGVLRIADRRALGTGALVVGGTGAVLELDGEFSAGNAIDLGGRALEVRNAGAAAATLAGAISNGSLVIGAGGAGAVNLAGNNAFSTLQVRGGARAAVIGARGIAGAHATVNTGGRLDVRTTGVQAAQVTIQPSGTLSFADIKTTSPFLVVDHLLVLEDQSVVALAKAPSSKLWLAATGDGVIDNGARLDVGPRTSDFNLLVEGGNLYAVNINWAANPGRDIVAAFDALAALTGAVYSRLDEGFIQPLVARRPGAPENGLWFKGFASIADYDGGVGRIGHKDDTRGGMAGYDKMLSGHLLLGGHLGYSRSSIKTGNGSVTDADQPWLGLYGAMKFGAFYLAADLAAGSVDADTGRPEGAGNFVSGSYKAVTLGGGAEIGLTLPLWSRATLKPAAAVHYMNYNFKDHGESAPQGIGAVIVDDFTADQVEGLASLQFTQQFTTPWKTPGMFNLLAGWRCALKDEATVLSARFAEDVNESVTILGDVYDRDRLNLGFGLRVALTGSAFLTLAYDYEIGQDLDRGTVSLGASWSW